MTTISWTHAPGFKGISWNPIAAFNRETGKRGWFCTKPSAGCKNCYAESRNRHIGNGLKYTVGNADKVDIRLVQDGASGINAPFHWRKPRMVFVCSMTDLFHELHSDAMLDVIFAVMAMTPRNIYQVLTKRPERMRTYIGTPDRDGLIVDGIRRLQATGKLPGIGLEGANWPLPNVWIGTTTENQETANERIPQLLSTPAALRWVSAEPLLGPIDFTRIEAIPDSYEGGKLARCGVRLNALTGRYFESGVAFPDRRINWVVPGLESGGSAREGQLEWIRDIVAQSAATDTRCFVKQLGRRPACANDWHSEDWPGATVPIDEKYEPHHQGELAPLSLIDAKGEDWTEWPVSLRVREWPDVLTGEASAL